MSIALMFVRHKLFSAQNQSVLRGWCLFVHDGGAGEYRLRYLGCLLGLASSLRLRNHSGTITTGGKAMQKSALRLAILLLCTFSAFSQQTQRQTALREIIPSHCEPTHSEGKPGTFRDGEFA